MPTQQKQFKTHIHCITKFILIAKLYHSFFFTIEVRNRPFFFWRNIYLPVNHRRIHKKNPLCNECITEFWHNNNKEKLYRPVTH